MVTDVIPIASPEGGPQVRLLDARSASLDERGLREWAHAVTGAATAPHVTHSYRYPYALTAWHSAPVGIDIERIESCDASFAESICTPSETVEWTTLHDPHAYFSSMWCSKEALAKALGDALRYDPRRLESPMLWPGGRAGTWRAAQLPLVNSRIGWLCWRSVTC
jgi:4'-phosphopantetheinyl transferase superfamily